MKKLLLISAALLLALSLCSTTATDSAEKYISQYSDIAVSEMYRSGIPASITLAQGLLESSCGKSPLATQGNNHFGIKCHKDWTGERVYFDDDEKGECFRKYPQVRDSYLDHSDFLRFRSRYASLFELDIRDYKSWAYGLKAAGYATDPSYPTKLIGIIERYNLSRFDARDSVSLSAGPATGETATSTDILPATPLQLSSPVRFVQKAGTGIFAVSLSREVLQMNGIPFIYAREGETYRSIAHNYDFFPGELASFNEEKSGDRQLDPGEVVYLQRKASRAAKGLDKHICEGGENLKGLSQKYAVRLKSLMKYNKKVTDPLSALPEDFTVYLTASAR